MKFNLVCKSWKSFLKTNKHQINQKRICAVNKIGEWYLSKNLKFTIAPKLANSKLSPNHISLHYDRSYLINMFPKYTRRLPRHPGTEKIINKIRYFYTKLPEKLFLILPYEIEYLITQIEENSDAEIFIIEQNNSIDNLIEILNSNKIPQFLSKKSVYIWLLSLELPYFIWPYLSSKIFYTKTGKILSIKNKDKKINKRTYSDCTHQ
jgi:hypothetical protein